MKKSFNLNTFRKKAFYEGIQGYWNDQTKACQVCYKYKYDEGKTPQEAWQECIEEYNTAADKAEWLKKICGQQKDKNVQSAKTPAAQKIIDKK